MRTKRTFADYLDYLEQRLSFPDHAGRPGMQGGSMPRSNPHSPTRPAGDDPFDPDPQIAALQKIARDTTLDRPVRQQAFNDVDMLKKLQTAKYSDGILIKTKIDELFASGANRIITTGPRAYLVNDTNKDKWTISTKLERDYADFKIRYKNQELSFPDHAGRPGFIGGSAPRGADAIEGRAVFNNSLGILRKDMPQLKSDDFGEFLNFAKDKGVEVKQESVPVGTLRPTQKEYNPAQAAQLEPAALTKPLTVSEDSYILDGTNRYVRILTDDQTQVVVVNRIMLPVRDALSLMRSFPKSFSKDVTEVGRTKNMAAYFSRLLDFHLGPGPHPNGTDQDVHAGDDAGAGTKSSSAPVDLAKKKIASLEKIEPRITKLLSNKAAENGGEMYGLDNKFKKPSSMARKIETDAREKSITTEEAAAQINDGLRYTAIFGSKEYTAGVKATEKELLDQGFERYDHKRKNFFNQKDTMYQGYNTVWIDPKSGSTFEVQFHTDDSMRIKKAIHPMYEQFRISQDAEERATLANQMLQAWADPSYMKPVGYESLGTD